jgi:hypothetical protein
MRWGGRIKEAADKEAEACAVDQVLCLVHAWWLRNHSPADDPSLVSRSSPND